jgi:hypothetical protein
MHGAMVADVGTRSCQGFIHDRHVPLKLIEPPRRVGVAARWRKLGRRWLWRWDLKPDIEDART